MAITDKIDRMTAGINRAGDSLARLNDEIDRAASTEFTEAPRILAPSSFTPPSPLPFPPGGNPPGPIILGPNGRPVTAGGRSESTGGGSGDSGSSSGGGMSFTRSDKIAPYARGFFGSGPPQTREFLDRVCRKIKYTLPGNLFGQERIEVEAWDCGPSLGIYVDPDTMPQGFKTSGRSSGGSEGAPGRARASSDIVGLADDVFSSGASRGGRRGGGGTAGGGGTGSATGASTVSAPLAVDIDSRPITDRLDGLRSDIRELSRSLAGDGGAGIRFKGGL